MVTQVIQTIIEALTGFLTGLGSAVIDFFDGVFITTGAEGAIGLTNFGALALTFVGISVAYIVCRWVFKLIRVRR